MTHIHRLKIVLPARLAGIAPHAAREIAERMVDAAHDQGGLRDGQIVLQDTGQTPAQLGLSAAQNLQSKGGKG